MLGCERRAELCHAVLRRVHRGEQRGHGRAGPRGLRDRVLEQGARLGQGIDVRRDRSCVPVAAEVIRAQRIDQNHDDIRRARGPAGGKTQAGERRRRGELADLTHAATGREPRNLQQRLHDLPSGIRERHLAAGLVQLPCQPIVGVVAEARALRFAGGASEIPLLQHHLVALEHDLNVVAIRGDEGVDRDARQQLLGQRGSCRVLEALPSVVVEDLQTAGLE